jgi:hypothetical protein
VIKFESEPLTLAGPGTWSLLARDEGFGEITPASPPPGRHKP